MNLLFTIMAVANPAITAFLAVIVFIERGKIRKQSEVLHSDLTEISRKLDNISEGVTDNNLNMSEFKSDMKQTVSSVKDVVGTLDKIVSI